MNFSGRFRRASLPSGSLLVGLDMLARAQFLEGLAGKQFNSVSAPAGSGKAAAQKVIIKLLQILDPAIDVTRGSVHKWVSDEGSSGLYRAAWLGANKILSRATAKPGDLWKGLPSGPAVKIDPKTWVRPFSSKKAGVGVSVEPEDILAANMIRYIPPAGTPKLSESEIENLAETASMDEKQEILESQESAIKEDALSEAANIGNFFWTAGKRYQPQKDRILSGDISVDDIGGSVAKYAANAAIDVTDKMKTEARKLARALRVQMLPGATEEGDFDLGELTPEGWSYIIQEVLADPMNDFSFKVFGWMQDDVEHADLSERERHIMKAYVDAVMDGRMTDLQSDRAFIEEYNRLFPYSSITPSYLSVVKNKYLGKGGEAIATRLRRDAPQWKLDAEDFLFLMNAQRGRGRFASQRRTAADRALRSTLIRLAHEQPALRPHLLPLLARKA
jgi:hypothetical protein